MDINCVCKCKNQKDGKCRLTVIGEDFLFERTPEALLAQCVYFA